MDILTGSSQNFFVLIASFAFALFASAVAVESIRNFNESPEDLRHLNLMLLQAGTVLIIAVSPLVSSSIGEGVKICSFLGFILSTGLITHVIWGLIKGEIVFYYKNISFVILALSLIICIMYLLNSVLWGSIFIYRLLLLFAFLFLSYRYYLVLGHFINQSKNK